MSHVPEILLEGLRKAIQAEVEGRSFYLMAAQSTADPNGKQVFERMADEERLHAEYLRAQYRSLSETGRVDSAATLGATPDWKAFGSIFSADLKQRAAKAHFEMAALSIASQLEADAQRFYRGQADAAADPAVKAFYRQLADWESGHYHALLSEQQALQEEYWAANEFSPF